MKPRAVEMTYGEESMDALCIRRRRKHPPEAPPLPLRPGHLRVPRGVLTVIRMSALMAPLYTMTLGWRIAISAAMINVSSPSSVARICKGACRQGSSAAAVTAPWPCQ